MVFEDQRVDIVVKQRRVDRDLDPIKQGQVPGSLVTHSALRGEASASQGIDVEMAVESHSSGTGNQMGLSLQIMSR